MNYIRKFWLTVLMVAMAIGLGVITQTASASFIAYDSTRIVGNQNWTGGLGMDFDVISPILILELGAYDSDINGIGQSNGTLTNGNGEHGISVGIFDRTTGLLVGSSAIISSIDPLTGRSRYEDITNFLLGVGSYSIVAVGFGLDPNGNTNFGGAGPTMNTGGGLISFVGTGRYTDSGITTLVYPTIVPPGTPANVFDAGTFKYEAATAVPEPTTMLLLGLGLVGLAGVRRKFKK